MSMFLYHQLISLMREFQQMKWAYNKENVTFHSRIRCLHCKYPYKNIAIYIHLIKKAKSIYICFQTLCLPKIIHGRTFFKYSWGLNSFTFVAERTSYFCLARKLIWLLWSSHTFTQWGWLIEFSPDHFPGQHKNGESPPNYLFLRTFRAGRTYFLSAPFIAVESQQHEESRLIYGPFESTLLDQVFPVEHELDAFNLPLTGTHLCRL